MNNNAKTLCQKALDRYGFSHQVDKAIEEMGECSTALMQFRHGRADMDSVISEIADVVITVNQLAVAFGYDKVQEEIDYKLSRLDRQMSISDDRPKEFCSTSTKDYYYGG